LASVRLDVDTEVEKLKAVLGNHHALMTEIRNPLRSMSWVSKLCRCLFLEILFFSEGYCAHNIFIIDFYCFIDIYL